MVWNRKNEGKGLIVAILVPILIMVLISSIFFAILEGTIGKFLDFVEKAKGAIVGGATRGIQWLGFSTVKDGLSTFVIKKDNVEELRNMIESYNISTEAAGMTEVRLRKMLLGYAVSNSLGDTICAVEVSEDEIIEDYNKKNPTNQKQTLDEVLAEYTKESSKKKWKLKKPNYDLYYTSKVFYYFKDEDKKFDSSEVKWYLAANGATKITTSDGDELKYVEPTDFVKLKTEWEDPSNLNKLSTNPDSQYMKLITSYTKVDSSDGSNKIKIYTTDISEKSYYYCFENNSKLGSEEKNIKIENPEQEDGKEFKYDIDKKSTYKAIEEEIDLNDSIDLSNYAIPVELMMDMLNITGSGEFLETFIDYALAQIETSVTAQPLTNETVEYNQTKYTIDPNFTVELYDMYDYGTQSFATKPFKIFGKELGQIEIGNIDLDNKNDNFIAYHDIIFNRKYADASIPNNRVTSINNYKDINYNGNSYIRKLPMGTEQNATFSVDALESYLKSAYDPADDFQLGTINVQEVICKTSSQTKKQLMVNEIKTWYGDFKYQVSSPEVFYTVPGKDDNATQADYEGYNQTKMSATDAASKADESKETIYIYEKLVEQVKNQTPGLDASKEYHEQASNDITNDPMNTENGADNKNHFINWTIIGLNEIANNDGGEKNKDIKGFAGCDYMYCYYKKTNIKEYKATTKSKREIINESNIVQTTSNNDVKSKIYNFLELLRNGTGKIPTSIGSEGGFKGKSENPSIVVMYEDIYDGQAPVGNMLLDNGALMLFQLLESSENTNQLVSIFQYMAYLYSGVDYGITDVSQIVHLFNSFQYSGTDFTVHTGMSSKDLVLDKTKLKKAIEKTYTGQARNNLLGCIDSFIKIQTTNNVNAVFAVAVTTIESSSGTDWKPDDGGIDQSTYNWFSIKGSYNGQSYTNSKGTVWKKYPSFGVAVEDFGDLISDAPYYFKAGKYTVKEIGKTYCNDKWGDDVISQMTKIYNSIGISLNTGGVEGVAGNVTTFTVNGRTYKNYKQLVPAYKSIPLACYPETNLYDSGCAITSDAIIASGFGANVTPVDVNKLGSNNHLSIVSKYTGKSCEWKSSNVKSGVIEQLKKGYPAMVYAVGGTFNPSGRGHFFVILSISENGKKIYVSNPAGTREGINSGWVDVNNLNQFIEYMKMT